ncbi:MAG: phytoene desaturase [Verrucomicrobiota bacterium]
MIQIKAPNAAVIGSGFGGLAAAIRLQAKGYETTLFEMRDQPGGRAYVYKDQGFTYDAGPTIITAPFLIDELFELTGRDPQDYIKIVPNDPFYRIYFEDGRTFDYTGSEDRMCQEIAKFNPNDVEPYKRLVAKTKDIFDKGFTELADEPFSHFTDMLRVAPDLVRLRSDQSVYKLASSYIKDPQVRQVLSFHPLLVGGNPFRSSSIYAMIQYLERKWGVHFAMGGTGALVNGFVKLFEDMGGTLRLDSKITKIEVEEGHVRGLEVNGDETFATDLVVSNGDVSNTYQKLVAPEHRKKWTDTRLKRMKYSMGLFLIYFGTNRTYPDIPHHSIILTKRYQELIEDIFDHKILADDFSLYLHAPTRTDPSLAPDGHECFYVLSPVPHLGGDIDWESEKERYAESILESLETICPDLRKHIVSKIIKTPVDFEQDLDAYLGNAFQFEPVLTQSAWFRPHNVSEDIKGLFLVGAGTHPGAGVPGVLSSAKLLEKVIPDAPERDAQRKLETVA